VVFRRLYFRWPRKTTAVFGFFGVHTLLWLPRSYKLYKERKKESKEHEGRYYIQRFTPAQRITHLFVIISFVSLAIIGASGLMLWFPEFFTNILPGWLINVATIIHSDEALLAVGFIFTVHFFNTHLRPEAFPMDKVIFTGVTPVEEYKALRPREYEELKASGALRKVLVTKTLSPKWERAIQVFGFFFLSLGIILIGLIVYSVLFGYK